MRVIILLVSIFFTVNASSKPLQVGDIPIDLLGKNSDGSEIKVSDYKGKVVIISFWASWCGPCRKELPVISGIQKKATTEKLQVISINIDDDRKIFNSLVEAIGETQMKFVYDYKKNTSKKYGVEGIPHMVIINSDGVISSIHIGYSESQLPELVEEINEIITHHKASS